MEWQISFLGLELGLVRYRIRIKATLNDMAGSLVNPKSIAKYRLVINN